MNSVAIIGRLVRDPELRHTGGGTAVCSFTVAVDRAGDRKDDDSYEPGFFDVTVWGNAGENVALYVVKGQQVGVKGRLFHHRWEAKDGGNRSKVEIVADPFGVDFLAKPKGSDETYDSDYAPAGTQVRIETPPPTPDYTDQDIPF